MSRELSLFETLGGTYTEVNGILYPNLQVQDAREVQSGMVGKYGHSWIFYMKENYKDRYYHYVRMGQLYKKAQEVNEEAYQMLETIMNQYLASHKPNDSNSTMEMWRLKEQAKAFAEEVVYGEIIYQCN